jgi:hypothetical protein
MLLAWSLVTERWLALQIVLAVVETSAYLATDFRTTVFMDDNPNSQLRINFNITMHDLSCDYATVDLVSITNEAGNLVDY